MIQQNRLFLTRIRGLYQVQMLKRNCEAARLLGSFPFEKGQLCRMGMVKREFLIVGQGFIVIIIRIIIFAIRIGVF